MTGLTHLKKIVENTPAFSYKSLRPIGIWLSSFFSMVKYCFSSSLESSVSLNTCIVISLSISFSFGSIYLKQQNLACLQPKFLPVKIMNYIIIKESNISRILWYHRISRRFSLNIEYVCYSLLGCKNKNYFVVCKALKVIILKWNCLQNEDWGMVR